MNEIKYTTDGKKVVVIGNLNAQEKIVQEVFITKDGAEIPSGENFVVKSLHDAPVISWAEKEAAQLKERIAEYKKRRDEAERSYESDKKRYVKMQDELNKKLLYLRNAMDGITVESFEWVRKFLCGEFKFALVHDEIVDIDKLVSSDGYNGIQLVGIYGNDKGNLSFRVNSYGDGSGCNTKFKPYETMEDAIAALRDKFAGLSSYSDYTIKAAQKYDIELDQVKLAEYKNRFIADKTRLIQNRKNDIDLLQKEIERISNINF